MDFLGSGLMGSLLGGAFRLAPELMKLWDRSSERKHEREMFSLQVDLEKQRGAQKLAEVGATHQMAVDTGVLDAFKLAVDQQTEMVKVAGGWVASLSASVRPVLTYYLLLLYGTAKVLFAVAAYQTTTPVVSVLTVVWSAEDLALLTGVVNYWMIDRTLTKRGLS